MNQDWPDYPNKNAQVLNTSDLKKNEAFVLVSNTYHCCMRGHPSPLSQDSSSAIHPTWVDQMQEVACVFRKIKAARHHLKMCPYSKQASQQTKIRPTHLQQAHFQTTCHARSASVTPYCFGEAYHL
eukprot:1160268-Pelagomonas_calceolata.AAC.6